MKINVGIAVAAAVLFMSAAPASHSQSIRKQLEATDVEFRSGGPKTPAEVQTYLQKMRGLIDRYNGVVYNLVANNAGGQPNPANMAAASLQTQELASEIRSLQPPDEIASAHLALATTLGRVDAFLKAPPGPASLPQAFSLITNVQSTMGNYRAGTNAMVQKHRLDPGVCDPFGGESEAQKNQASGLFESMKGQLMSSGSGAGAGGAAGGMMGAAGGMMGAAGSMLGGGADALGGLGSMLGGMGGGTGGGGLGGLSELGKMFGGGGAGGLGGLGGGGAGAGGADAGGTDMGGPSLDPNGLQKQMGDQQKVIEQLLNE